MHHRSVMFVAVGTAALTLFTGAAAAAGPQHLVPQAATSGTLVIDTAFDLATRRPRPYVRVHRPGRRPGPVLHPVDIFGRQPRPAAPTGQQLQRFRRRRPLHVHPQPEGGVLRREAGDGGGRRVFVPAPAKPTGEPSFLLDGITASALGTNKVVLSTKAPMPPFPRLSPTPPWECSRRVSWRLTAGPTPLTRQRPIRRRTG